MTRRMHANSLAAYDTTDFSDNERAILRVLAESSVPLTDREIAQRLGVERCIVQPRVSEMLPPRGHILTECQSVKCATTGKTVRTVTIAVARQESLDWMV